MAARLHVHAHSYSAVTFCSSPRSPALFVLFHRNQDVTFHSLWKSIQARLPVPSSPPAPTTSSYLWTKGVRSQNHQYLLQIKAAISHSSCVSPPSLGVPSSLPPLPYSLLHSSVCTSSTAPAGAVLLLLSRQGWVNCGPSSFLFPTLRTQRRDVNIQSILK